ncbi:putative Ser/Thr protein phosphatase family protein [Paratrimastix pyriformis]|uniref:Ser/Thr protein phosphatase family protein n=1 Tax=Paratrimastix pyriformis TaxID=342808 RepID=A0ABQ8UVG2_9EUKA|nr:putative Ser/Thr protein phosphatase family protein [Paratrimastix pyriformis]
MANIEVRHGPTKVFFRGKLKAERIEIPLEGIDRPIKISFMADLHFDGNLVNGRLTRETIANSAKINNDFAPDLVLFGGDYVHIDTTPINVNGTRVLRNEVVLPFMGGVPVVAGSPVESLPLVGMVDMWQPNFDPALPAQALAADVPRIVMEHNPDALERMKAVRSDLVLSGHTHGGQVRMPCCGCAVIDLYGRVLRCMPGCLRRKMPFHSQVNAVRHWEWSQGLRRPYQDRWLYTTRGIGSHPPGRLNCPPEIALVTLHPLPGKPARWRIPTEMPFPLPARDLAALPGSAPPATATDPATQATATAHSAPPLLPPATATATESPPEWATGGGFQVVALGGGGEPRADGWQSVSPSPPPEGH